MSGSGDERVDWTVLAHLLRPQGRKGELLAELLTDFPDRFDAGARVYLAKPEFHGPVAEAREIAVLGHWLPVGRNHGRVVLAFAGIDSIEKAEGITRLDVVIPTEQRVELDDDAEYISDLIGCAVFDGGMLVGTVSGLEFPTTADGGRRLEQAAPLLTIVGADGDEILLPYVQAFLVSLDAEAKKIEMNLPEGLVEINRSGNSAE